MYLYYLLRTVHKCPIYQNYPYSMDSVDLFQGVGIYELSSAAVSCTLSAYSTVQLAKIEQIAQFVQQKSETVLAGTKNRLL